jgi:hypothetical protein
LIIENQPLMQVVLATPAAWYLRNTARAFVNSACAGINGRKARTTAAVK